MVKAPLRAARAALLLLVFVAAPLAAQQKPTLTPDDYGKWESLGFATLSSDGSWLAYPINRVNGENELRIRPLGQDTTIAVAYATRPTFSSDSRWLAYSIGRSEAERDRLRKANQPIRDDLELRDLRTGETTRFEGVASFAFSDDGAFLAMSGYSAQGSENKGVDLVVRDLAAGTDVNFGNVSSFAWQDDGVLLAMTIDARSRAGNGVRVYDARTGVLRTLVSDAAEFKGLAWREDAADLAALRVTNDSLYENPTHTILAWTGLDGRRVGEHAFDPAQVAGFPADTRVVDMRPLQWAEHGRAIFFGVKEWERKPGAEATELVAAEDDGENSGRAARAESDRDEEPAGVEVWHSHDVDIIPEQKVRANRDRNRNYAAAWHLDGNRFVQLTHDLAEEISFLDGDRQALVANGRAHDADRMFGPVYRDFDRVDVATGERTRFAERVQFAFGASPGGRYFLYLADDHYWTVDLRNGTVTNITSGVPTSFVNLDNDHTIEQKPPFGVAGWLDGDRAVILNDKYDLWEVRPDGSRAERITRGAEEEVRHRYVRLDPDEKAIDRSKPLYLSIYGEKSKKFGYARVRLGRSVERLVWLDKNVGRLARAKDAETYAFVIQGFDDSPDYFVAGADLANPRQVTRTNPFQDDYAWGRSELVEFQNAHGQPLQGALFYPANYEPGKTYPMIVYIYEIRSNVLHNYSVPTERNAYNPTVFTQEGYFVFQPDIVYRPRNPGLSAVEALEPAVEAVVATGMVDPDRVGLIGHSWGGYQTTFAVTQTDVFAAAVAGAPLTNLFSMYLSIYWNSGGTDARIFEISQGRMEVPFWEDFESYAANSPVFHIEKMNTPLLMAFGTKDGAVEFNQGVEMYNAARRAGKDMVLLVYEGENHSLARKPNQLDYHSRTLEWFAHYLKGEEPASWITDGLPFLERERELQRARGGQNARR